MVIERNYRHKVAGLISPSVEFACQHDSGFKSERDDDIRPTERHPVLCFRLILIALVIVIGCTAPMNDTVCNSPSSLYIIAPRVNTRRDSPRDRACDHGPDMNQDGRAATVPEIVAHSRETVA